MMMLYAHTKYEGVRLDILTLLPREYQNVKPDPVTAALFLIISHNDPNSIFSIN